jgi:hypothetical protein
VGLSWQQGPLSTGAIGRFLVPEPLPKRLLYVEPLRRRMRVRFGGNWVYSFVTGWPRFSRLLTHWHTDASKCLSSFSGIAEVPILRGADVYRGL